MFITDVSKNTFFSFNRRIILPEKSKLWARLDSLDHVDPIKIEEEIIIEAEEGELDHGDCNEDDQDSDTAINSVINNSLTLIYKLLQIRYAQKILISLIRIRTFVHIRMYIWTHGKDLVHILTKFLPTSRTL